jgi:hypothetical protein
VGVGKSTSTECLFGCEHLAADFFAQFGQVMAGKQELLIG